MDHLKIPMEKVDKNLGDKDQWRWSQELEEFWFPLRITIFDVSILGELLYLGLDCVKDRFSFSDFR